MLDTNAVAATDTNLFNVLASIPDDNGTNPVLQVLPYGDHTLLFKASHFDYSSETTRDFCLAVCDKVETPLYRSIDLYARSNNVHNGGWLAQGFVSHGNVTDTMFLMVSNTSRIYNGFFRAIPYGGPQISVAGAQANDTVSNNLTLQVAVDDLSGVTNTTFSLSAYGVPTRYAITGSNTVVIDTKYNFNGPENLYFSATTKPLVYDPTNSLVDNAQIFLTGQSVLPLDFENPIFLAYQSDAASLDVGQNDVDFYATIPITYTARIKALQGGRTLKTFSGTNQPGYVLLLWNFTEQNGITPFTNDAYVVEFTATPTTNGNNLIIKPKTGGGTSFNVTNVIDDGVRKGAGVFITYQEEDPGDTTGSYWNDKSDMWARQTLRQLYVDQYKPLSLTQYTTGQVGTNRNHANCTPLGGFATHWSDFMPGNLANPNYSDMIIAGAHCDALTMGSSKAYLNDKFMTGDLKNWLSGPFLGKNWRLRMTQIWGCWSGAESGGNLTFPEACGIRPPQLQMTSYCKKNAGFFFLGGCPQIWVTDNQTITDARAAYYLTLSFMCGKNAFPGTCDPTYSFRWALAETQRAYPEMEWDPVNKKPSLPVGVGCPKLIHTTVYDDEITHLNFSHVKEN